MRRADDAQILHALGEPVVHLHRIRDSDIHFAAGGHRNDHLVARGGLHEDVQSCLFLENLGNRGSRGVVERARLQRGEAISLCRRHAAGQGQ
jgi:hypothetical protein